MAIPEAEVTAPERRASLGWRVAGAFIRRREASIFVVAIGLCVYFSLRSDAFYSGDNLKNITETMAPIALIAAGEVMLLICREIDLSVGRVYALAPAIVYVVSSEEQHGLPIWVGVLAALGVACARRAHERRRSRRSFGVPSFITTLGMLFLLNGITLHLLEGTQVFMPGGDSLPEDLRVAAVRVRRLPELGVLVGSRESSSSSSSCSPGRAGGCTRSPTGGNLIGAAEAGVNVRMIKIGNFMLCNLLAGLRGDPRLDAYHDDRPVAGRRPTSCSSPSQAP